MSGPGREPRRLWQEPGQGLPMLPIVKQRDYEWGASMTVTTTCAHCPDWRIEGLTLENHELFMAHLAAAHPEVKPRKIKRRPLRAQAAA